MPALVFPMVNDPTSSVSFTAAIHIDAVIDSIPELACGRATSPNGFLSRDGRDGVGHSVLAGALVHVVSLAD